MFPEKPSSARRRLTPLLLCLLLSLSGAVQALSNDRNQPIDIAADSVKIDEAKGTSTYKGNVEINQGSIRLLADQVVVTSAKGKQARIVATGKPATFRQRPDNSTEYVTGAGKTIEYAIDSEELVLVGQAKLTQGGNSFRSDRIIYDRVRSVMKGGAAAKGRERVKVTIQPGK